MSSSLSFLNFQYKNTSSSIKSSSSSLRKTWFSNTTSKVHQRQNPSTGIKIFHPNLVELRIIFDKFDANKDGRISLEEYKSVIRVMGGGGNAKLISSSEMGKAFRAADSDGDGFIDFEEFIKAHQADGGVKSSEIEGAFRVFDLDRNGKISAEELWEVMRRLGERSNLEDCRKMIRGVDADGDGLINKDEFMTMMTRTMKLSPA